MAIDKEISALRLNKTDFKGNDTRMLYITKKDKRTLEALERKAYPEEEDLIDLLLAESKTKKD